MSYLFSLICIISLGYLIYFTYKPKKNYRLLAKITTSLSFLLIALSAYLISKSDYNYFMFIFMGLIFSFLGDIFLALKSENRRKENIFFLLGVTSFSITHIFYSLCFINLSGIEFKDFIISVLIAIIIINIIKSIKGVDFSERIIPVVVYSFIISFMVVKSIFLISEINSIGTVALTLIILGTCLFIVSDIILAFIYFYKGFPKILKALNSITYYSAQILLSLSILYII